MLDWLIIGGGIHGTHLARALSAAAGGGERARVRVLDPGDALLSAWTRCTQRAGMRYLRSPVVHHLDLSPWSLRVFAQTPAWRTKPCFTSPYDRPSLALFEAHSADMIARYGLDAMHLRGRALQVREGAESLRVESDQGQLEARRVVLALGASEQPRWPAWAHSAREVGAHITHLFAPEAPSPPSEGAHVVLVGGGISSAQAAVGLIARGARVTILAPHAPRERQFDSDPGWLGPKLMTGFWRERDPSARRAMITQARYVGSMPADVARPLREAIRAGQARWCDGEVVACAPMLTQPSSVALTLASGELLTADQVVLATGFCPSRPGGALVDDAVQTLGLACAPCGYPVIDSALRWHPRLFVSGPLAELELGPTARNIAGARHAAERLRRA